MFYAKHKALFDLNSKAYAQYCRRIGSLLFLNHESCKATHFFKQAFKASPLDWRNGVFVLTSLFFPEILATKILSRYAVTRVGDYCQFH